MKATTSRICTWQIQFVTTETRQYSSWPWTTIAIELLTKETQTLPGYRRAPVGKRPSMDSMKQRQRNALQCPKNSTEKLKKDNDRLSADTDTRTQFNWGNRKEGWGWQREQGQGESRERQGFYIQESDWSFDIRKFGSQREEREARAGRFQLFLLSSPPSFPCFLSIRPQGDSVRWSRTHRERKI